MKGKAEEQNETIITYTARMAEFPTTPSGRIAGQIRYQRTRRQFFMSLPCSRNAPNGAF
jgi:hypothetical protein